jgi:hypothetical protein
MKGLLATFPTDPREGVEASVKIHMDAAFHPKIMREQVERHVETLLGRLLREEIAKLEIMEMTGDEVGAGDRA